MQLLFTSFFQSALDFFVRLYQEKVRSKKDRFVRTLSRIFIPIEYIQNSQIPRQANSEVHQAKDKKAKPGKAWLELNNIKGKCKIRFVHWYMLSINPQRAV